MCKCIVDQPPAFLIEFTLEAVDIAHNYQTFATGELLLIASINLCLLSMHVAFLNASPTMRLSVRSSSKATRRSPTIVIR